MRKIEIAEEFNFEAAREQLDTLERQKGGLFTFQTFLDEQIGKSAWKTMTAEQKAEYEFRKKSLVRLLHGTFNEHKLELKRLNLLGAGIFFTVNRTNGLGRKEEDIVSIRSLYCDKDGGVLSDLDLMPTLTISSKSGDHGYWVITDKMHLEDFKNAQKGIIDCLRTDPSVCDLPRVMRLAGFFHLKELSAPYLVTIKENSGRCYRSGQIAETFTPEQGSRRRAKHGAESVAPGQYDDKFRKWCQRLTIATGEENYFGGRNCTLLILIREGLACSVDHDLILTLSNEYCDRSGEHSEIVKPMLKRQIVAHSKKPFEIFFVGKDGGQSFFELAKAYIASREFEKDDGLHLRFYQQDFYLYRNGRYELFPELDLQSDIISFLQSLPETQKRAGIHSANNIMANLQGFTLIPSSVKFSTFLDGRTVGQDDYFIPLLNGILDLKKLIAGKCEPLLKHTPQFFSISCLPFPFDLSARCPKWFEFLREMLPAEEVQNLLQEWLGYNVIFETNQQKFIIFYGDGANGKSVVCVVCVPS